MRQLFPAARADIDVTEAYAGPPRPCPAGRPWVLLDMITSLDGATALDGASAPLGGPADKRVFHAIRSAADVIVAGAETVRTERYGPPRLDEATRAARVALGRAPCPTIVVVTASLRLDPDLPLFGDPTARPVVATVDHADPNRRAALEAVADVRTFGSHQVDLTALLAHLHRDLGARVAVVEGGPGLNAGFVQAGLLDEVCVSVAPLLVAGDSPRLVGRPALDTPVSLRCAHVLEDDGFLFLRYVRAGVATS